MNIQILSCSNGYLVTKYNHDPSGYPYQTSPISSINKYPQYQEQFVFANLEESLTWVKTNAVLEKLQQ